MKALPQSEDGYGVLYTVNKHDYVISQNTRKEIFTLWRKENGQYEKLATGNSPTKLYTKIHQIEKV